MLDIFRTDAFNLIRMTDAIGKQPFVPGRLGQLGVFKEGGVDTLDIAIEEKEGQLYLIPNRPRGADPTQNAADRPRKIRSFRANHLPVGDKVMADEVQGVRAFGSETAMETVQTKINEKLQAMSQAMEATHEHHRIGAIKGTVLDADGVTVLHNWFDEFDIQPYPTVNFDFAVNNEDTGAFRQKCAAITRDVANALGLTPFTLLYAMCGDNFFDALIQEPEVRNTYKNQPMAAVLREGYLLPSGNLIYGVFEFGGIIWENYRGSVGGVSFVDTDSCHIFPFGVPGLFRTAFAPANYMETVNTLGRPLYAKITPEPKNRWADIDVQSNPLTYCTRPKVLISGVKAT